MNLLGIFAKYWQPGTVKTRLAAAIGAERAGRLQRAFVGSLTARLADVADRRLLACWPPERRVDFLHISGGAWEVVGQQEGDLGARMRGFFEQFLAGPADRVVLIGSDSPTLPVEYIAAAFDLLETHPVVLGPSRDGGYYLVGAAGAAPPIFAGIDWSTSAVWRQTVERLEQAALPFAGLPEWYDVDQLADLHRLQAELVSLDCGGSGWSDLTLAVEAALSNNGPCTTA